MLKAQLSVVIYPLSIMTHPQEDVSDLIEPILKKSKLPSLSVAAIQDGELVALGAAGSRQLGGTEPVTINDKYHLGSCTKPMTATLIAVCVEKGILTWQTTIGEVLDEHMTIHDSYKEVTIEQLLAHVGGAPGKPPIKIWLDAWNNQGKLKPRNQRYKFAEAILAKKPDYTPGSKTVYSNQGYAIAGVMLEVLTDQPWEDCIREKLLIPLGMNSAGFRAPEKGHPLGHHRGKPMAFDHQKSDNPDAIGPAGTIHMTVADWAKFALFHLNRDLETGVLTKPESFEKLNSTLPKSKHHGVGGWLVHDLDWAGGHCLQMTGSNTMWFAMLWIMPEQNQAYLVATNSAKKTAFFWCDKMVVKLIKNTAPE